MSKSAIFSEDFDPVDWMDIDETRLLFGTKAATLTTIPRQWTPPFALIGAEMLGTNDSTAKVLPSLDAVFAGRIRSLAMLRGALIVRSSVIGETIWDRGTYESVVIQDPSSDFDEQLMHAMQAVAKSARDRRTGLVLQSYVKPRARGEFGNLLRVSKTRDQWELTYESDEVTSIVRFNVQRDSAADPSQSIEVKAGVALERVIGPVCAWLNNELLRGVSLRLNCEWVTDHQHFHIVQIDQEDEDFVGINPFQLRISPMHQPQSNDGTYVKSADSAAIDVWDKLRVLKELHEDDEPRRPTLFYVPLASLPPTTDEAAIESLTKDFSQIVGPDNIVIRTSVMVGQDKTVNLPRTEGLRPAEAARQCVQWRDDLSKSADLNQRAFVIHRFIAARAAAWARAEPENPVVEIHGLWGLPDALQYCPYDIWEVHVPTSIATEFTEYKSHMLIAKPAGDWEYVRIKNEFGRSLSVGRREALDIAGRTLSIANRLGRACHVMWFVGCVEPNESHFNLPWYWTEAHPAERNVDRTNYRLFRIEEKVDLTAFANSSLPRQRLAIELIPRNPSLFRDMDFIDNVGKAAKDAGVPVIIAGSTLAHAYYVLRRIGCTVLPRGEKEHTRVRRSASFGKIVRDKIPARIAARKEAGATRKLANNLKLNFLISKLLEEALEVRNAETQLERRIELADVVEIVRALAQMESFTLEEVVQTANDKRVKTGGFEEGLVLIQTAILGNRRESLTEDGRSLTQVLARKVAGDTFELPFTFFGFMEIDQPRSILFEDFGVRLYVTLKNDRIELRLSRGAEQLELPLDLSVN